MTDCARAIEAGALRWLACASMRAELTRTLADPALARWRPDPERVLGTFARHAWLCVDPAAQSALRCTDPDDQVFIDLALGQRAHWLVSHDRAVRALARGALARGLRIVAPQDFRR